MNSSDLRLLEDIKRLLMALLVKLGASSEELGSALRVDPSAVRRALPMKKLKKIEIVR